jgi:membrane-associated protein
LSLLQQLIDLVKLLVDVALHLDVHLGALVAKVGLWSYPLLFLVVFCETGLVVTPILPGDSLLFAVGALSALPDSPLHPAIMAAVLIVAALAGDLTNYTIGRTIGPRVFKEGSRFFKREYLERTQAFYDRHGRKTIIIARFVPIVRTFAPFVAGIGQMPFHRFVTFSVAGAVLWVPPLIAAGFFFGSVPVVMRNFHVVVVVIVAISVLPAAIEVLRSRSKARSEQAVRP